MSPRPPQVVDPHTGLAVVADAICTACGCTCDDVLLTTEGRQIVEARQACVTGKAWFLGESRNDALICTIDGRPATLNDGIERAAKILVDAKSPLVYGLRETTSEAQRAAASIADWIGGTIDTPASREHGPTGIAFQGVGEVTCTLGEIRNRSDFVIVWGADPVTTLPRHFTKFSLTPVGQFVPQGRRGRYAVVVDVRRNPSAASADEFIGIRPDGDFDAIWTLRALLRGLEVDPQQTVAATGVGLEVWGALAARMKQARYGAFLYGPGLTMSRGRHLNTEALLALTRDLNDHTRFVAHGLGTRGNLPGADHVLTWRTGFPFGVNQARGYPRFNPGEFSAEAMLARREVDAALLVTADPESDFGPIAQRHLASIPQIVVDFRDAQIARSAAVAFRTATYGLHTAGTVYRADGVPLTLRPAVASQYPDAFTVLNELERRILTRQGRPASAAMSVTAAP